MKKLISKIHDWIKWHSWNTVATIYRIEEHFNLSKEEVAMLEACISHKLLKEYVCPSKEKTELGNPLELYIVLKVRECRKLINKRRKLTQSI